MKKLVLLACVLALALPLATYSWPLPCESQCDVNKGWCDNHCQRFASGDSSECYSECEAGYDWCVDNCPITN